MFGLVAADVLYLKVDSETRAVFEAESLEPFGYQSSRARRIVLPYRRAPESALDDPEEFKAWAERAIGAAKRAAALKPVRRGDRSKKVSKEPLD